VSYVSNELRDVERNVFDLLLKLGWERNVYPVGMPLLSPDGDAIAMPISPWRMVEVSLKPDDETAPPQFVERQRRDFFYRPLTLGRELERLVDLYGHRVIDALDDRIPVALPQHGPAPVQPLGLIVEYGLSSSRTKQAWAEMLVGYPAMIKPGMASPGSASRKPRCCVIDSPRYASGELYHMMSLADVLHMNGDSTTPGHVVSTRGFWDVDHAKSWRSLMRLVTDVAPGGASWVPLSKDAALRSYTRWLAYHPDFRLRPDEVWGHSQDDERYYGDFETREEAIADGEREYGGEPFYVCPGTWVRGEMLSDAVINKWQVNDNVNDYLHEFCGAEDFFELSESQMAGLRAAVTAWAEGLDLGGLWMSDSSRRQSIEP